MSLTTGSRLGPYEIISAIGAGGMGEVYRARDTRLNRSVAVKVLPPELASDPDRRGRFEREAHAIAALSHPHICTIFDIGRENGTDYLVMELLEGETLADRLGRAKGRPLAMPEVMRYATEIADALDKAHRAGIVHRDLKPANIMLTKSGAKLLDFGLAKLKRPAVPISMTAIEQATTTGGPKTASGTILGTVHYMSAEQVEGREADTRSDIWALGVVIYEMATGTRPFEGESAASIIGAILKDLPPTISSRQPLSPAALDHIVERCLDKDPDERWQNAGDIMRELNWIARTSAAVASGRATPSSGARLTSLLFAFGVLALAVLAGAASRRYFPTAESGSAVPGVKFEVLPPKDVAWAPAPVAFTTQLAMSPDGSRLAFVASKQGEPPSVWVRPLDRVDAQMLQGTEGASFPFWSPDGRFLAFFAGNKLKKVDVAGGVPQALCDVVSGRGGTWSPTGVIVFGASTGTRTNSTLMQVSSQGGAAKPATEFDAAQNVVFHYWPQFLPDGRHFIYFQRSASGPENQGIYVKSLDSPSVSRVLDTDIRAVFGQGHLFFVRDGLLFAQPFDDRALRLTGEPVRIADNVGYYTASFGYAAIDVSSKGVLTFGPSVATRSRLQWFDRTGKLLSEGPQGILSSPRISPDDKTIAYAIRDERTSEADIWTFDLTRGIPSRITSASSNEWFPVWSADGTRLFFGSTRLGFTAISQKTANGVGEDQPLNPQAPVLGFPQDASVDGRFLLFHALTAHGYQIGAIPLVPGERPVDFRPTGFNEMQGRFSPNARWVAYASDETGRFEVYVRPFPAATERTPISIGGGTQPAWRRDGRELFYLSADHRLMSVPITTEGSTLNPGAPHALFSVNVTEVTAPHPTQYSVTGDGQRFLVNSFLDEPSRQTLTVVTNWSAVLKK